MSEKSDPETDNNLRLLIRLLGYEGQPGFKSSNNFQSTIGYRFALSQAQQQMGVVATFGLLTHSPSTESFLPLVYVSTLADFKNVQRIHQKIWSQGLVPFFVVVGPDLICIGDGFRFSTSDEAVGKTLFKIEELQKLAKEPALPAFGRSPLAESIRRLKAINLRSSLGWRDYSVRANERVDQRLLDNLDRLCSILTENRRGFGALSAGVANSLIGRLLFLYMLFDRGIISARWLEERGHDPQHLTDRKPWPVRQFWKLVDDLDRFFNGSTFAIKKSERRAIGEQHLDYLRVVIRHGTDTSLAGDQLSLFDIDFSVFRIETLSAVYELFLRNQDATDKKAKGAFYTAPFLADFVLDRIDEVEEIRPGKKLLDFSAGSGVFLVGSYRRLIERQLATSGEGRISLSQLRSLLLRHIFGVELKSDACRVAAFSLYVTMLDYFEMGRTAEERILSRPVFPKLIGKNILAADYFDRRRRPKSFPKQFDIIVGNPPWTNVSLDEPGSLATSMDALSERNLVGRRQAAELFLHWAAERDLKKGGTLGVLMPSSSLINDHSQGFRRGILDQYSLVGVANLTHFRRSLFQNAEKAASAVFLKKVPPTADTESWFFSPLTISQPAKPGSHLWTIVVDKNAIEFLPQHALQGADADWHVALNMKPVDRRIADYLQDQIKSHRLQTLGALEKKGLVHFKRGDSVKFTGVPSENQLTSKKSAPGFYLKHLLVGRQTKLELLEAENVFVPLPARMHRKIKPGFKRAFAGDVVLLPRSGEEAIFCQPAVAFNDTLIGIMTSSFPEAISVHERRFLAALAIYLNTNIAKYLLALAAPSLMFDIPRLTLDDVRALIIPFFGFEDSLVGELVKAKPAEQETLVLERFKISGVYARTVEEFASMRFGFRNSNAPSASLSRPTRTMMQEYCKFLEQRLNPFAKKREREIQIFAHENKERRIGLVCIAPSNTSPSPVSVDAMRMRYDLAAADAFTNSLFVCGEDSEERIWVIKPLEAHQWSLAQAYSDGDSIIAQTLVKSTRQPATAA